MQNPSVLATRATRKTTRFGLRDAKCNAAGAMLRVAWALQNSKAIGQKCEKPWENQGFLAERTGTELFDVLPMFSEVRTALFCRELEQTISKLPPAELLKFREWFLRFDGDRWDEQIEKDATSGKLDSLAQAALRAFRSGQTNPL
jgi:hypothetical protein